MACFNPLRRGRLRYPNTDVVVFIGHNEDGSMVLPSGKRVAIDDLAESCFDMAKICVFLSCESKGYAGRAGMIGVDTVLSLRDAVDIARAVAEAVSVQNEKSASASSGIQGSDLIYANVNSAVERWVGLNGREQLSYSTMTLSAPTTDNGEVIVAVVVTIGAGAAASDDDRQ